MFYLYFYFHVVFTTFKISRNFFKQIDKLQIPITGFVEISDPLLNNQGSLSMPVAFYVSRFHESSFSTAGKKLIELNPYLLEGLEVCKGYILNITQKLFSNIFMFFFCLEICLTHPLGTINI